MMTVSVHISSQAFIGKWKNIESERLNQFVKLYVHEMSVHC